MHPMFVKLFIETDADVCWPRKRPSGAARAGPGAIGGRRTCEGRRP